MKEVQQLIREFNTERDWNRFHTPDCLAKSVAIEAGELLECFQWSSEYNQEKVEEELADVLIYCLLMADAIGASPDSIIREKLKKNAAKYPVEASKGNRKKYTEL